MDIEGRRDKTGEDREDDNGGWKGGEGGEEEEGSKMDKERNQEWQGRMWRKKNMERTSEE